MGDNHLPQLAAYAVDLNQSRGRQLGEDSPSWRDEFQRDRDRVIHSSAFRRLEYKTQVFVNHEGDMFRTRLTHSLEVAQIARAVARALSLNEDLTEAIALAHDLGHTPFGHAGQTALNNCMQPYGGFEHNLHSLRVVDQLERRYPHFDGLNLLFETREGILKHCRAEMAQALGPLGERFLHGTQPTLEAQIANLADEIAYNHHDIDDGLRSGILSLDDLREHGVFIEVLEQIHRQHGELDNKRLLYTAIRTMLGRFVDDLITTSRQALAASGCASVDDVRQRTQPLIGFSAPILQAHLSLKRILHRKLYNDPKVQTFTAAAQSTVSELFRIYCDSPTAMPTIGDAETQLDDAALVARIADYIAGMTDRFAIAEHLRLVGSSPWPHVATST